MKIVCLQLELGDRAKTENVAAALDRVDKAPEADLILLPEIWPIGFFSFDRYYQESEKIDGPTVAAFKEKAKSRRCHIHMGSLVEREGDSYYNASVLISPAGEVIAHYRKIHLFGYQSDETRLLSPGSEVTVAALPWGRVVAEGGDGEDMVVAEIDPELPSRVRAEFPALDDRKLS